VVTRFDTFDIDVRPDTRRYMEAVLATPAFAKWRSAALQESWIIPADEVD
jgi:glutathione S-transferase